LEPRYADALPDLVLGIGPDRLAKLAAKVFTPRKAALPTVSIAHIHQVRVSVAEHAEIILQRLRAHGTATFRVLTSDCTSTLEIVARFLGLLELFRAGQVGFDQIEALGELTVHWTGANEAVPEDFTIDTYGDDDGAAEAALAEADGDADKPGDEQE
jgi:segregation and condensation protein A